MLRTGLLAMAAVAVMTFLWQPAVAQEPPAAVIAALDKIVPGIRPDSIELSALPGIYEISIGPMVIYLSEDGRHLIQGDLVDLDSARQHGQR
jgi:thiol:disulfide interchange protein DsbC